MLELRPATAGDLHDVTAWENEPDTSTWLGEIGTVWHTRALTDPDQEHVIAVDAGVSVGFAVCAGQGPWTESPGNGLTMR